jgi:hypothetical protein
MSDYKDTSLDKFLVYSVNSNLYNDSIHDDMENIISKALPSNLIGHGSITLDEYQQTINDSFENISDLHFIPVHDRKYIVEKVVGNPIEHNNNDYYTHIVYIKLQCEGDMYCEVGRLYTTMGHVDTILDSYNICKLTDRDRLVTLYSIEPDISMTESYIDSNKFVKF